MANRRGKSGNSFFSPKNNSDKLYFLGSKTTADSDYRYEIKTHLLLGRKAVTNLDNI